MSDFWTRRRAAVKAEAQIEEAALVEAERLTQEAEAAERPDEDLLQEAGLKPPEELATADEVQEFLKSALPQRLKTRALRRLWRLNPVLANVDGLVDYGEDYTDAALVIPDLKTVYQVGKGMIAKLEEFGADEEAGAPAPPEEAAPVEHDPSLEDDLAAAIHAAPEPDTEPLAEPDPEDIAPLPASARRMRFQFAHTS